MKKALSILLSMIIMLSCFGVSMQVFAEGIKGTAITSVTTKTTSATVKWKKQTSGTSGYEIRYSKNSDMSSSKKVTVSDKEKTSKTISSITSNKKYYFQIRTYKKTDSGKKYSSWSEKTSAKTKASSSSSSSKSSGNAVYITPTGKKYHYDGHCNGGTYIKSSLSEAKNKGLTPCKKCVK